MSLGVAHWYVLILTGYSSKLTGTLACYFKVHRYPVYSSKHHVLSVNSHTCVCIYRKQSLNVTVKLLRLFRYLDNFCVVTCAPWLSASVSSELTCLLYAILMGVSIFLNIFCLIKHAKVIFWLLCQT